MAQRCRRVLWSIYDALHTGLGVRSPGNSFVLHGMGDQRVNALLVSRDHVDRPPRDAGLKQENEVSPSRLH